MRGASRRGSDGNDPGHQQRNAALLSDRCGRRANPRLDLFDPQIANRVYFPNQLLLDVVEFRRRARARFADEVDGAKFEGAEYVVFSGPAADHNHRRRTLAHHDPEEGESVHSRHLEINGNEIRLQLEGLPQGLLTIARNADDLDQR